MWDLCIYILSEMSWNWDHMSTAWQIMYKSDEGIFLITLKHPEFISHNFHFSLKPEEANREWFCAWEKCMFLEFSFIHFLQENITQWSSLASVITWERPQGNRTHKIHGNQDIKQLVSSNYWVIQSSSRRPPAGEW